MQSGTGRMKVTHDTRSQRRSAISVISDAKPKGNASMQEDQLSALPTLSICVLLRATSLTAHGLSVLLSCCSVLTWPAKDPGLIGHQLAVPSIVSTSACKPKSSCRNQSTTVSAEQHCQHLGQCSLDGHAHLVGCQTVAC